MSETCSANIDKLKKSAASLLQKKLMKEKNHTFCGNWESQS